WQTRRWRPRMGAALFGLLPQMSYIYDVMRSTKKLEGLLISSAPARVKTGSTRWRRQRGARGARGAHGEEGLVGNRPDAIGHSSGRRTPLVYGGVYIWHDAAAMHAYF